MSLIFPPPTPRPATDAIGAFEVALSFRLWNASTRWLQSTNILQMNPFPYRARFNVVTAIIEIAYTKTNGNVALASDDILNDALDEITTDYALAHFDPYRRIGAKERTFPFDPFHLPDNKHLPPFYDTFIINEVLQK